MCGRFTLRTPANLLVKHFGLGGLDSIRPRYNVAPTQNVAVVRLGPEPAQRELTFMRWGLVPFWADDQAGSRLAIGNRMINARAETVAEKPAYKNAFRRRRCLVVADGYYEWQKTGGPKQPYYFHMQDDQPLAFAGLWEIWDKAGEPLQSCTIITTDACELTRPIHDRMPVILPPESYATWLDPATDQSELVALLCPYEKPDLVRHPVSTLVNSAAHEDPRCVECVDVEPQKSDTKDADYALSSKSLRATKSISNRYPRNRRVPMRRSFCATNVVSARTTRPSKGKRIKKVSSSMNCPPAR
jgi:putative SOS response-associated peptidase YedK